MESIEQTFERHQPKVATKRPVSIRYVGPIKTEWDIPTLEGVMKARAGDYIIQGVNGEFYPCKPDIFRKTYQTAQWD